MGGIAAIAKARRPHGDRLRRQRLSADVHAAAPRSASTSPKAGTPAQLARRGARRRRVRRRQRRLARQSADGGDPRRAACRTSRGRSGCTRTCCTTRGCSRSPARTARRRRRRCSRGSSSTRASTPGFLIGGVPVDFRRVGAADRQRVLRDRGRRVRHGVLRQALEVRPLPAAHRDPQQPRIRPRRHLSRPRGDRDAVPPPRAHDAAATAASSSTAARRALARVLARGCWSEVERFGLAEVPGTGPGLDDRRRRHDPAGRRARRARSRSASRAGTTS